jgi:transcriptional regulator GlxA family with amidase domain
MTAMTRVVWLFTFARAELLDLAGPWSVLGHANDVLGCRAYQPLVVSVAGGAVTTRHALSIAATLSLGSAQRRGLPHTLIVSGGTPAADLPEEERRLAGWLRRTHAEIPRIVAICTGAFVLGAAGLLDGHRVTTHWQVLETLARTYPHARVVNEGIFQRDGRLWTSAGVTAGIDLLLALVEDDHGHAVAMSVASRLLLFLRRTGGQAQFSEALHRQREETPRLRDLTTFVARHLDEPLPIDKLADHLHVSVRSLTRWCRAELAASPAAFVRRIRTEEARRLLADTDLTPQEVARRTGLGDVSTLFRVFSQGVGTSPLEYRRRFGRVSA